MPKTFFDVLGSKSKNGATATGYHPACGRRFYREANIEDDAEWKQRMTTNLCGTGVAETVTGVSVNTTLTGLRIAGVLPSIPSAPEEITTKFIGRWIKAMPKARDFLIDEHKFLDKQELRERLDKALDSMPLQYVHFADDVLRGARPTDAYLVHIRKIPEDNITKALRDEIRRDAHKILKKEKVKEYISASIKLSNLETMEKLQFNEAEWLSLQRDLIHMAMGRKSTPKTFVVNGEIVEQEVRDVALAVGARALETVAKMNGWLSEKMELTGDIPTIFLKDFAGSGKTIDGEKEDITDVEDAEISEGEDDVKTIGFVDSDNEEDYQKTEPEPEPEQANGVEYDWES